MSCETLTSQQTRFNVSAGALPEGFCPATLQEFFEAMVARMIIGTNQQFSSFVIGPNEPTSNQGPWLKDCTEWFFFDDNTGRYIPQQKSGFNNEQFFAASGTFVVPDFIFKIRVTAWGAGGGGGDSGGGAGGGGGGGAFTTKIIDVVPAQAITITVGAGGANGATGSNGGDTTVLTLVAGGGGGGVGGGGSGAGGIGGVATGGIMNFSGGVAPEGEPSAGALGGSSPQGGMGGTTDFALNRALAYNGGFPGGGGAGGAVGATAGIGAGGAVRVEW